jgi:hypothetical protein
MPMKLLWGEVLLVEWFMSKKSIIILKAMKKAFITLSLVSLSLAGYSQKRSVIQNPISQPMILDFLKNGEPEIPKTQIMTDYLKNYQEKML